MHPFSMAHSFMACATALAESSSSAVPFWMVSCRLLYTGLGSRSCMTLSLNTMLP